MVDLITVGRLFSKNNLKVSDNQLQLLEKYVFMLREWNKKINLISRKDTENVWIRHIIGSLSFLFRNSLMKGCKIADVGTGGGLPGIPLAIILPDCNITLIDSIKKKIMAVDNIAGELGLKNVSIKNGRVEELSSDQDYKNSYDYVIARAVAPVGEIIRWTANMLISCKQIYDPGVHSGDKKFIPQGSLIMIKGGEIKQEIERARLSFPDRDFDIRSVIVEGINPSDLYDKKIVIARERIKNE